MTLKGQNPEIQLHYNINKGIFIIESGQTFEFESVNLHSFHLTCTNFSQKNRYNFFKLIQQWFGRI